MNVSWRPKQEHSDQRKIERSMCFAGMSMRDMSVTCPTTRSAWTTLAPALSSSSMPSSCCTSHMLSPAGRLQSCILCLATLLSDV